MEQGEEREDPLESDNGTSDDEREEEDSEGEAVQTLVAGRERRQKAANRYEQLLLLAQQEAAQEEGQDDLTLLFHEEDEDDDVEFEDPDNVQPQSDIDSSSSDEEDNGPTAGDDDLEGERQLEKEERAKRRANKRKADKAFVQPPAMRKKVKIAGSAFSIPTTPAPQVDRQRKKSERVSWLPTEADAPARTSSRTLSVLNKQKTILSMKQNEKRRVSQLASMEASQKRKEATKVQPMTQAERMAEAGKTERLNSKSLNKWEETEKDRLDKQKARLEALQNRKIEGPFIRWYSGPAEWVDGKLLHVGRRVKVEEVAHTSEKDKATNNIEQTSTPQIVVEDIETPKAAQHASMNVAALMPAPSNLANQKDTPLTPVASAIIGQVLPSVKSGFLDGLEYYASLSEDTTRGNSAPPPASDQPSTDLAEVVDNNSKSTPDKVPTEPNSPAPSLAVNIQEPQTQSVAEEAQPDSISTAALTPPIAAPAPTDRPASPPPPSKPEFSTRNLLTLLNFDPTAVRDKDIQRRILFNWSPPSSSAFHPTPTVRKYSRASGPAQSIFTPGKPIQPVCAITAHPAKYRDPVTGLPYAGMEAFKAIRRTVDQAEQGWQGAVWSGLLGAWAGPGVSGEGDMGMRVARGVPEGFVRGHTGLGGGEKEVKIE